VDISSLLLFVLSILFSFVFFFVSLYEGFLSGKRQSPLRAIILCGFSLLFSFVAMTMVLTFESPFAVPFYYCLWGLVIITIVIIIVNAISSIMLIEVEGNDSDYQRRNRVD